MNILIKKKTNKTISLSLKGLLFILCGFLFSSNQVHAQQVTVYKIKDLVNRIHNHSDTLYVINFWATWCKPCIEELPAFEKIQQTYQNKTVQVLLISLDFKDEMEKKVYPFLQKNKYSSEIILLDEINGNDFIDQVSKTWTGSIPATLLTKKNGSLTEFLETKVTYNFLVEKITKYLQ